MAGGEVGAAAVDEEQVEDVQVTKFTRSLNCTVGTTMTQVFTQLWISCRLIRFSGIVNTI